MLRLFGNVVCLTHKIIDKFMCQSIKLSFCNHVDHVRNASLSLLDVKFESFCELLGLLVMLGSTAPLRFTLIILSDSQVLIDVSLVNLENDLCIFVHFLVRLGYDKSVLTASS